MAPVYREYCTVNECVRWRSKSKIDRQINKRLNRCMDKQMGRQIVTFTANRNTGDTQYRLRNAECLIHNP